MCSWCQPDPILPEVHFTNYEPVWATTPGNVNRILVEVAVDGLGTFTYNIDNIEPESK
jgi:hypothetical protein